MESKRTGPRDTTSRYAHPSAEDLINILKVERLLDILNIDPEKKEDEDRFNQLLQGHYLSKGVFTLEWTHPSPPTWHTYEELAIIKLPEHPSDH